MTGWLCSRSSLSDTRRFECHMARLVGKRTATIKTHVTNEIELHALNTNIIVLDSIINTRVSVFIPNEEFF